jgi:hypothetical protein
VDLISTVVLVPHVQLLKLSCDMVCGTRIGVPICVNPIRGGGNNNSPLFLAVAIIKMVPALNNNMALRLTDLAYRTLTIVSVGVVVVVGAGV